MTTAVSLFARTLAVISIGIAWIIGLQTAHAFQLNEKTDPQSVFAHWSSTASTGNSLDLNGSELAFQALPHTLADIRKPLTEDLITFSAKENGWGSIYLVWNEHSWCGVGQISPTPFGRLYSVAVINGHAEQENHRGIHIDSFRWVRIRLGENYISFAYSNDGSNWVTLRTIIRPPEFSGAPHFAVAGKYYQAGERPFDTAQEPQAPHQSEVQEANGQTHGQWTSGRIQDISIVATPLADVRLTEDELKSALAPIADPVMALLKSGKDDPSYEQVSPLYPAMKFPREVVGVPWHPLDIGVDYLGRLNVSSYEPVAWLELGSPSTAFASDGDQPLKRQLFQGYIPIDILSTTRNRVEYTLTILGWSDGFSVDKPLYAYLKLSARSVGGTLPRVVSLVSSGNKRQTWKLDSVNGTSGQIAIRFKFPDIDTAQKISLHNFTDVMNTSASLWRQKLSPATRFAVPDTRVMNAYRALLAYSMLDTDTVNGYLEPHDGAGFYESMFGMSISMYAMMLDQYGLHDYAARILATQMHLQRPDGLYTQDCGLDDPGTFLMGLVEHYWLTEDKQWLKGAVPAIVKQAEWIIRARAESQSSGVVRGLIKFRPYNDYVAPTFNYLGNVECAMGLLYAGEALKTFGDPHAEEFINAAEDYRKDILASMDSAMFIYDGEPLLPMEPDTRRLLKMEDYQAGGYYGLTASPLLEPGFLSPHDTRAKWIVDALERRGGLIAGLMEFNGGMDHAYSYGYLLNALKLGEIRKTLLGFWSMVAFGMSRDTYSPVEVTMIRTGENELTLPHLFSCTQQLRLLRSMLLREDGDVLQIGEGTPRSWIQSGRSLAVTSAPTQFGETSYRIEGLQNGIVHVRIVPPSRRAPKEIRLHLRVPGNLAIESVKNTSHTAVSYDGEMITFHELRQPTEVYVRFKREGP
jgi:hypothetical protein